MLRFRPLALDKRIVGTNDSERRRWLIRTTGNVRIATKVVKTAKLLRVASRTR